ncbi:dihydrodipicolinate synthetase [Copromyces sp. CBS 386.78]|nr:dihydrodipicolinate synthetase [Copromyces sp. CBS 386.78]
MTTASSSSVPVPVPPKGVWVPSPTFFTRSSPSTFSPTQPAVDYAAQTAHTLFLARSGITGVVLLGSTGEAMHLSRTERSELVRSVRQGLDEAGFDNIKFPIMAGVLTNGGVEETVQWLDDYKEAGAQFGLVLVPGYFGQRETSQEGIVDWFGEVINKTKMESIVVYNYPGVTNGVVLEPEGYRALALRNERVVGCKMSHGNISHHLQVSLDPEINHERFRVFSGFGQQLGPIVLFGAAGVIDGMSAYYPKTVVRLFELAQKDDLRPSEKAELNKLQYVVSKAEEFIVKYGLKGIKEATYRVAGFGDVEAARVPVVGRMGEKEWEEGKRRFLGEIDEVEKRL